MEKITNEEKTLTPQEFISLYQSNPKPMPMTNEEKSRQLANYFVGETDKESAAYAYSAAMVMAQWKDEQSAKEKQQWIEKAVIFLNERVCTEMSIPEIHNMIVDFRKSMEE